MRLWHLSLWIYRVCYILISEYTKLITHLFHSISNIRTIILLELWVIDTSVYNHKISTTILVCECTDSMYFTLKVNSQCTSLLTLWSLSMWIHYVFDTSDFLDGESRVPQSYIILSPLHLTIWVHWATISSLYVK